MTVTIMDYSIGEVFVIKLTVEEQEAAAQYEYFDEFLRTIEDKYGFRTKACDYMSSEFIRVNCFKDNELVATLNV